jgi:NADH-quinone oxidoreductase subunit K
MGQEFVLLVSASVFCVGACGFVIRKNPLIMFMDPEPDGTDPPEGTGA